jgi:thiosulfate/3-mercaptopyruvate sulfurtransferase
MRVLIVLFSLILSLSSFAYNKYVISPKDAVKVLGNKDYIFISVDTIEKYQNEHIPNSIHIDSMKLQDIAIENNEKQKCNYLPLCPKTAEKVFSGKGISNDKKLIIYYTDVPHKATYLWFVLYSMGMDENNMVILDGGLKNWKKLGFKTVSGKDELKLKGNFKANPNYKVVATFDEVLKYAKSVKSGNPPQDTILIDVRHFLEYSGRQRMKEIKKAGHIPGAKFLYWKWFLGKNSTFKPISKLKKRIKKLKIDLNKKIILYCTIGNRSSFAFLGFKLLGAKDVKIYTGGWYEWGNRDDTPVIH